MVRYRSVLIANPVYVYLVGTGLTGQVYGLDVLSMTLISGLYAADVDLCGRQGGVLLLGMALFFGLGAYGRELPCGRRAVVGTLEAAGMTIDNLVRGRPSSPTGPTGTPTRGSDRRYWTSTVQR